MPEITLLQLRKLRACAGQCDEFKKRFGKSVEVTEELCLSVADVFDWAWATQHLLGEPALAEYDRLTAPAWAEWAEYKRARAAAWADYKRARAAAWADYKRAAAQTFARLFNR